MSHESSRPTPAPAGGKPAGADRQALERAVKAADEVFQTISARLDLLAQALRIRRMGPAQASAELGPRPPPALALERAIAARCHADPTLALRVETVLYQAEDARTLLETLRSSARAGTPGGPDPSELCARMAPLARLHRFFARDPVLARLFAPPALFGLVPPPPLMPPPRARTAPFSLGALLAAPPHVRALERLERALGAAAETADGLQERMKVLKAALDVASGAVVPEPAALSGPARELVRLLVAFARDPEGAKRMAVAVHQCRLACQAISEGRSLLERARRLPADRALEEVRGYRPERLRGLVTPLQNLHLTFQGHPVLARLFAPPARTAARAV